MKKPLAYLRYLAPSTAFVAVLLASPASLRATTYTWTGNSTSLGMGNSTNWGGTAPVFDTSADLQFTTSAVTNTNMWVGGNRTVRSLSFGAGVVGPMGINTQDFNGGVAVNLTLQAASGNSSITMSSGSTGTVTMGNATSTSGSVGNLVLGSNLDVSHNGTGALVINRPTTGAFDITKIGTGTLELRAFNTFTGALNINGDTRGGELLDSV